MKNGFRASLAAVLTAVLLCFTVLPASAAQADAAQAGQTITLRERVSALASPDNFLPDAVGKKRVTAVMRLSDEEVEQISGRLAENSDIYLVEMRDGRYTYYITVDFRGDDAVYFCKLPVMRATSRKLYTRSQEMAAQDKPDGETVLMSYQHIFGELSLHYIVYRVTGAFGGEKLPGALGSLYRKSAVADLNIDEDRLAAAIRLAGQLFG